MRGSPSSLHTNDENNSLKEKLIIAEEENNMLKYKIELLLDMVSERQKTYMLPYYRIKLM